MNEQLKALYDSFYELLPTVRLKREIEDCHQKLIEVLSRPERRLVFQIIDAKDQIAEERSIDSFIAGFCLAWRLSSELNMYEKTRPMLTPREMVAGMDAFEISEKTEEE